MCRLILLAVGLVGSVPVWAQVQTQPAAPTSQPASRPAEAAAGRPAGAPVTAATAASPLDFTVLDIEGREVPLARYRGQVVLIVNVASQCGLTPQYEQLQALHERYAERGLRILAFPANNFGGQEPGTNAEIQRFCTDRYRVRFDLFGKISVRGADQHELYKFLTSPEKNGRFGGDIQWNFTKFLIGRDGRVVARFEPRTKPDAAEVVAAIEQALATAARP